MTTRADLTPCGLRHLDIPRTDGAGSAPAIVQYPAADDSSLASIGVHVGPYQFDAALNATPAAGQFPLCLISHGGGGSHLLYRSIGTWFATHGFVVVCPEHPGDNRNDRSLVNTDEAAIDRPRHSSRTIDAVLADPVLGPVVDTSRIAVLGHSMGGFTALALVGGQPWSRARTPLPTQSDARVRAAVLLAPSTDWFLAPHALSAVSAPLLVMAGELDDVTPPAPIRQVMTGLPATTQLTFEVVIGAGHYAFLTPFPPPMQRPDFPPSVDPARFDREAFHRDLPRRVHQFLVEALGRPSAECVMP